jgi:hypothetical protein
MSCYINEGYVLDCRNSVAGIKALWILGNSGNTISGWTSSVNEEITSISGTGVFYKFEIPKQSSNLSEAIEVNTTTQGIVFVPTLTVNLPKLNNTLRNLFQNLVSQNNIYAVVLDNQNQYWSFCFQNGAMATAGTLQSGTVYNDLNGISALTLVGGEENSIQLIDAPYGDLASVMVGITVDAE